MAYKDDEIAHLLRDIRRPYQTGGNRDALYTRRRSIRHRTARPWLPEDIIVKDESVYFRDPLPAFVVNRIKQRLGANAVDITVRVAGDAGPKLKESGNKLEDWLRGCWDYLDPLGLHDGAVREHQSTDGVGFYALECLPNFLPPEHVQDMSDKDYDDFVSNRRREWPLPMRLSAPDPRSLYWIDLPDGKIPMMCEVIDVPLASCKDNWIDQDFRLAWKQEGEKSIAYKDPIVAGKLIPAPSAADYGKIVRIVKLSNDTHIYHAMYQQVADSSSGFNEDPSGINQLTLLAVYPNHLRRVPYFMAAARRTTASDPANRYEPLAMEVLDMGEYINQLGTLQMVIAMLEVLKPMHFEPNLPPPTESEGAAATHLKDIYKPGILKAWGKFAALPSLDAKNFEAAIAAMTERQGQFNMSLSGMLQGGQLGKSTPAWSLMQINEEQVGFISDALTSRATAIREVLEAVLYLCKTRYAADGPVYVRGRGANRKDEALGEERSLVGLAADDLKIPHDLEVTIEGMTQSQRAANTEYGRELLAEDSISRETYLTDYVGLKDVGQEKARQRRERLERPLDEAGVLLGLQRASNAVYEAQGNNPLFLPIIQAAGLPMPSSVVQQQQMAAAQQQQTEAEKPDASPRMPGQGMSDQMPTPPEPRQMGPQAIANGNSAGA